jgi:hypothetical protein
MSRKHKKLVAGNKLPVLLPAAVTVESGPPPKLFTPPPGIQMQLPNDTPLYSTRRDLAHIFGDVMLTVADRLAAQPLWSGFDKLVAGETPEAVDELLNDAVATFMTFMGESMKNLEEDMPAVLQRVGYLDVPRNIQVILMATLGQVLAGHFFNGIREATIGGDKPAARMEAHLQAGREMLKWMVMPRWKRRLLFFWRRIRR